MAATALRSLGGVADYLVSKGVPREAANRFAETYAWEDFKNDTDLSAYLDNRARALIEQERETQRARNQADAGNARSPEEVHMRDVLVSLGYLAPDKTNSAFDVSEALRDFQRDRKMPVTGAFDEATEDRISNIGTERLGPSPKPARPPAATPAPPASAASRPATTKPGGGVFGGLATAPVGAPVDVDQEIRDRFPAFAWLLDDPEIGDLMRDSVTEGWPPEQFQARLYGTKWWKTHAEPVRKWDTLRKVDPAEADRQLGARQAELWDLAFRLTGKKPNANQVKMLAEYGLRFGLNEAQIRDQLVSVTNIGMGVGGEGLQVLNQLRQVRDAYTLPVHGKAMYDWTRQILAGESTVDDFQAWALERARGLFAGNDEMNDNLLAGRTVRQLAGSYIELAAQELGINPDSIRLTDDRWMRALHHTDPQTGKRRMMNLDEWRREIRTKSEYGFDGTTNARGLAAQLRSGLEGMFGVSA